eukprot:gene18649-21832_t
MEAGPHRMYAQQAPAFEARSRMITDLGPSTEDSPPVFTLPDIEGLKALKKQVVENLPTKCVHCEADMLPEYCTELRDGTVMAYCKKRGACGRSLVLFAGVKLVRPVYRKICPFQTAARPADTLAELETTANPTAEMQTPPLMQMPPLMQLPPQMQPLQQMQAPQMQAQQERWQHLDTAPAVEPTHRPSIFERFARGQIDVYELHGIKRPDEVCQRCEKSFDEHEHVECDKFGWVHDHDELLEIPADWPTYDHGSHGWKARSLLRNI